MPRPLYARQNEYPSLPGWTAYIEGEDDMGPDNITGFGRNPDEARADLEEQITADAISQLDVTRAFVAGCVKRHQELKARNRHHMDELAFHWLAEVYDRETNDDR